jgi:hypothetical protein
MFSFPYNSRIGLPASNVSLRDTTDARSPLFTDAQATLFSTQRSPYSLAKTSCAPGVAAQAPSSWAPTTSARRL